jgi:uncharacterized protein (DUF1015 family)
VRVHGHDSAARNFPLPTERPFIQPFAGLRVAAAYASEVASPPYDVLSTDEARALARGKRWSFLHVSRPEIDFPADADPKSPDVYAAAGRTIRAMVEAGVLVRDAGPRYYIYRLTAGAHAQTGIVVAGSVDAYETGRIRRHEAVRTEKVVDRTRQIEAVGAHTGPVLAVHRANAEVAAVAGAACARPSACSVAAGDGVGHELWVVDDPAEVARLTHAFAGMTAIYIADGHHRAAAAAAVARARRAAGTAGSAHEFMMVVSFPHDQLRILPYHRVIRDLDGKTPQQVLAAVAAAFVVRPSDRPLATLRPREYGMYLAGRWHRLAPRPDTPAPADRRAGLDVSVLADRLIAPVFGIRNLATDGRIDYLGGSRGADALVAMVDSGEAAVAITLAPTPIEDVFAVADAGEVMPPKSTWFDPKLADGLVSYPID